MEVYNMILAQTALSLVLAGQPMGLEDYSLQPISKQQVVVKPAPEPTKMWRALGWATYLACGSVMPSVEYRQSRSDWTAPISGTAASASYWTGIAQGSNMTTDWVRRTGRSDTSALVSRLTILGVCAFTAGQNFNKGWERQ